jgi:ubiquinone/menaquinone biosynthesis C-methylase UbiE
MAEEEKTRRMVREGYAKVAKSQPSCCAPAPRCSCSIADVKKEASRRIGYSDEEMESVPEGANLGLGCGNPLALALLHEGATVLDLGSGAGFDCFLAAKRVGKTGKVIGVDMTPEMLDKARENARRSRYANVEFRLGEIENLPVADASVDMVISNCVINLSPNKPRVFKEAFRVLKPGGQLMISDIVLLKPLPDAIRQSVQAYIGCVAGAEMKPKYLQMITDAGFQEVKVLQENRFAVGNLENDPTAQAIVKTAGVPAGKLARMTTSVVSVKVSALKPKG